MNLPNRLTVIRIILSPLYLLLAIVDFPFHYLAAALVFVLASLTDWLDGKIARRDGLVTNFGKFLDPLADKMLTTAAFLSFLAVGELDVWAVMVILTREFMVTSIRLIAAKDGKVIAANFLGKLKTVAQYIAIIYMLAALEFSTWGTGLLAAFDLPELLFTVPLVIGRVFIWISVILTAIAGVNYVWQNREYFSKE